MGRAKKGKKGGKEEEVDDEYDAESSTPVETAVSKGKEKKGKRKGKEEDEDKNEQAIDEEEMPTKKKGKDKKKVDDDLEDLTKELENVTIDKDDKKGKKEKKTKKEEKGKADDSDEEVKVTSKKPAGKKKGKEKIETEESDDDIVVPSTKSRPKGGFALLAADDSDDTAEGSGDKKDDDMSEEEEKPAKKGGKKGKGGAKAEDNEGGEGKGDGGKGGKKGKKKKKDDDDEDDLEKLLAELAIEYSGGVKEEAKEGDEGETKVEKEEKEKKGKKGKVKEVKETKEVAKEDKDVAEEGEGGEEAGTVKTAAQKKKEKKEREKQKKLALKKQEGAKKTTGEAAQETVEDKTETETKPVVQPAKAKAATEKAPAEKAKGAKDVKEEGNEKEKPAEDEGAEKKEGEKEEGDDKKKKKKKDAKEDDKKKGPGKKTIAAMQEALKKMKEEEERLAREEEERLRKIEEAEKARLEQIRLEQERKERKKKKEKERKERLKAEGKFLTPKQKADRARAQAMLEALKAQGVEVPEPVATPEKRAARPGTRIRPHKAAKSQAATQPAATQQTQNAASDDAKKPDEKVVEVQIVVKVEDDKKEKKEEAESDDGVRDAWDEDTSEEEAEDKSKASSKGKNGEADEEVVEEDSEEGDSESDDEDSDDDSSDEDDSGESEEEHKTDAERRREKALARIKKRREDAEKTRTTDVLRAAVICVLGHVDTGKTKILDKLRRTNVQDGEAGGITQQIGATNVPMDAIKEQAKVVKGFADFDMRIPGLLIIDTPGHESFSNLRSRGSSLCDMAVLVVDIMHGLEPQTLESIGLLKTRKTPFIVALNKIDRLYDWQTYSRRDIRDVLKNQAPNTQLEFEQRTKEVIVQFAEQGLNAALFYENPDPRTYVSLVPTSAITGEGMGNLLALLVQNCQTMLAKRLMYSDELQATVLEVKAIPGLGTTIDAILVNGRLREGDTMILAGTDGPIVTQIRSLLMPQPMKELRVKNAYIEYKEVQAAQGVKIAAKDLEKSIAGLNLLVAQHPDEVEIMRDEVAKELNYVLNAIKLQERGVYVQASTLGSLEALLEFLRTSKIPYSGIRIGPVVKKDVMKVSAMLEHESQYATILAFDVKIERDAQELADSLGVKIFQADIIYHLFDKFMAYREELKQRKRDQFKHIAVFPCKLKVLPQFVFNSRDPIVVGVMVEAGVVKEGTPICVPSKEFVELGVVTSIEVNHKTVETARKGQEVCIKIEPIPGEAPKMFGRHFDEKDLLISKISRQSIDACKDYFRDDLLKTDWQLMVELKKLFQIL